MKAIRILGLAVAVAAVAVLLLSMLPALAQPIAGAHYTGMHSGGGTIQFAVSPDGGEVQNLQLTAIPCDSVPVDFNWPALATIPIVDDQFDVTLTPTINRVTGSFASDGTASGTFVHDTSGLPCQSPELTWTATTTTLAVGGIAELPDVSGSSAASYIPSAGLAAAALVALAAGGWHARRRFSQGLIRLRRRLR